MHRSRKHTDDIHPEFEHAAHNALEVYYVEDLELAVRKYDLHVLASAVCTERVIGVIERNVQDSLSVSAESIVEYILVVDKINGYDKGLGIYYRAVALYRMSSFDNVLYPHSQIAESLDVVVFDVEVEVHVKTLEKTASHRLSVRSVKVFARIVCYFEL